MVMLFMFIVYAAFYVYSICNTHCFKLATCGFLTLMKNQYSLIYFLFWTEGVYAIMNVNRYF